MSFFSPITARARSTRALFFLIYVVVILGALTVVVPLVVTLAGATNGQYDVEALSFYPKFLINERALWARYLDAKYGGDLQNFRMGWGATGVDFYDAPPPPPPEPAALARWEQFLAERAPRAPKSESQLLTSHDAGLAFTRSSKREAALENRNFRRWLVAQYGGDLGRLNADLLIQVTHATNLLPPVQARISQPDVGKRLEQKLDEYLQVVPLDHRLLWNAGNFFRAVYLPRTYGPDITGYNSAAGTRYASYADVPFPALAPREGREAWFNFVHRLLNLVFVTLSAEGRDAQIRSRLGRLEFIRTVATPEQLRVESVDVEFAAWAAARGVTDARIPQPQIDWAQFQAKRGFWRWQFTVQNFQYVLDEVLIQGNGIRNTLILIVLTVLGALTVNPLAAYALSRYRLRQGYHLLLFFLATVAFPAEIVMIPNFLQLKELGLLNTFAALVLPGLVNGFSIFLLKGFFDSIPRELYEAADIDGAGEWQIFWGLTMSLSKPILAVIALNAFVAAYGAFFFALILAPDQRMWTLMVWIYQLRQTAGPGVIYASLLITAVPTFVVYVCAQNVILRGVVVPTEK